MAEILRWIELGGVQTNLRAGYKSALQPGTMTGRRSETFEDLLYLFSSEDKYKGFSLC